eukprot:3608941-Pyramimonas_sp.AAC.1
MDRASLLSLLEHLVGDRNPLPLQARQAVAVPLDPLRRAGPVFRSRIAGGLASLIRRRRGQRWSRMTEQLIIV